MKIDRLRYRNRKESRSVCRRVRRISERMEKAENKGGITSSSCVL